MKFNIAIDGPSASGKSTIAKALANHFHFVHLDSGAMYRCVALKAMRNDIDICNEKDVMQMLYNTSIILDNNGNVFLDNEDVTSKIRTNEISMNASTVSKLEKVREDLVNRQQNMAKDKGFIMDGRDIGTVVLKDAEVKIFQTASSVARAKRRYKENIEKGQPCSLDEIQIEIEKRDIQDTTRENSPLKKAEDAFEIDTSDLSIDEVVSVIVQLIESKLGKEEIYD